MASATFTCRVPLALEAKVATFATVSGQSRGKIVSLALADRFSRYLFPYEPKRWELEDGVWQVEVLEHVMEGLVRFYGLLFTEPDVDPRPMSALIVLDGITAKSSMMDILDAKWVSMRRD